jgi:hypothetical protein
MSIALLPFNALKYHIVIHPITVIIMCVYEVVDLSYNN